MMYYSRIGQASGTYVNELLNRDEELISEMHLNNSDPKNIYRIFRERLSLYERAAIMPLIEDDRRFLEYRRNEICVELREFRFMQYRKNNVETNAQIDGVTCQFVATENQCPI